MNAQVDRKTLEEAAPLATEKPRRGRRRLLIAALPLALALVGGYVWVTGGRFVATEDAYVKQDRISVVPQVTGPIAQVMVGENDVVAAGQTLFTLDAAAYRTTVEQDQAKLESARLGVEKPEGRLRAGPVGGRDRARRARDGGDPRRPPAEPAQERRLEPGFGRRHRARAPAGAGRAGAGGEPGAFRTGRARRQPRHRDRRSPGGARGARRAARGRARPRAYRRRRAAGRRGQPDRPPAARAVRDPGGAGADPRRHRRHLDRGELQGDRPHPHAAGARRSR